MSLPRLLPFVLCALMQLPSAHQLKEEVFDPGEKERLSRAQKVDDRIKIYTSASKRLQRSVYTAISDNNFSSLPKALRQWVSILSISLEDIDANLNVKKKSKPLIRYEIQVRKALTEFKDYKASVPIELQDEFDDCLDSAEKIRKRFMDIIFR